MKVQGLLNSKAISLKNKMRQRVTSRAGKGRVGKQGREDRRMWMTSCSLRRNKKLLVLPSQSPRQQQIGFGAACNNL